MVLRALSDATDAFSRTPSPPKLPGLAKSPSKKPTLSEPSQATTKKSPTKSPTNTSFPFTLPSPKNQKNLKNRSPAKSQKNTTPLGSLPPSGRSVRATTPATKPTEKLMAVIPAEEQSESTTESCSSNPNSVSPHRSPRKKLIAWTRNHLTKNRKNAE